ncbi:MAG TPA: amidohydrolase family protein, partial [Acidimicrobiia bacterium]|nr:amidohydrolase family protein [Acidimicrobiia bacterium]
MSGDGRVIDIHCHRECGSAAALVQPEAERLGRKPLHFGNEMTKEVNRRQLEDVRPKMEDVEVRLADMDAMGVDVQVISLSPYQLFHWAGGELGIRAFQTINDDLTDLVAGHPDRFLGLAAIPLQEPSAAIAELRRCSAELGFRGIEMATHIAGEELSSPRFEDFWA